jgi:hypothetical protein
MDYFEPFVQDGILIGIGSVMSPELVRERLASREKLREIVKGWFLCGDVSSGMYDTLVAAGGRCEMSLGIVSRGSDAPQYALFGVDVRDFRHLFILPMFEPPVIGLLQSLRDKPLQISLARQNGDVAALVGSTVPWPQVSHVLEHKQHIGNLRLSDIFEDSKQVLERVRTIDAVEPVSGGHSPRASSISFVAPRAAFETYAGAYGMTHGASQ